MPPLFYRRVARTTDNRRCMRLVDSAPHRTPAAFRACIHKQTFVYALSLTAYRRPHLENPAQRAPVPGENQPAAENRRLRAPTPFDLSAGMDMPPPQKAVSLSKGIDSWGRSTAFPADFKGGFPSTSYLPDGGGQPGAGLRYILPHSRMFGNRFSRIPRV